MFVLGASAATLEMREFERFVFSQILSTTDVETYELRISYEFTMKRIVKNGEKLANFES